MGTGRFWQRPSNLGTKHSQVLLCLSPSWDPHWHGDGDGDGDGEGEGEGDGDGDSKGDSDGDGDGDGDLGEGGCAENIRSWPWMEAGLWTWSQH